LKTPAAVRFVNVEPMLGKVDLKKYFYSDWWCPCCLSYISEEMVTNDERHEICGTSVMTQQLIYWVICGGETGPGARKMELDWARDLRDQCVNVNVPFFFKQRGSNRDVKAHKYRLDGKEWKQFPIRCHQGGCEGGGNPLAY
jgi:protein gp37